MPRRTRLPGADEALAAVREATIDLDEAVGENEAARAELDDLWAAASAKGATYQEIADASSCSESLVKQRIARLRGSSWASLPES